MAVNPPPIIPKSKSKMGSLVIMMSIATVLGLIAAIGIWQYLSQTEKQVKELTVTKAVVVASKDIPVGTMLTNEYLAVKDFPAKAIPEDYPGSIEQLLDKITKTSFKAGEIITQTRLISAGAEGGLRMVIPKGHRATTIKVTEISGVGGYLKPGDRVDIISVLERSEEIAFSKTILQNVLVVAAGDAILDLNNLAEPGQKIVSQVTVALTPKDTEQLALASQVGELQLILRPLGEEQLSTTPGSDLEDIYGNIFPSKDIGYGQPIAVSTSGDEIIKREFVEIILGNQKSYYYY